eukprot:TRINITY_DN343_c0_g1_i6.p1 TRINITY_DN343_c0_g1~~TRINITY_DN343_c0_g1_i6.p1  ORF type:complete len:307 (-),score=107.31 TRINITY_DN343_c0_g1_i6:235-1095(-)
MADVEYEEATPEEKLRIATHFVLSSPPGQLRDVVNDVKVIVNDNQLLSGPVLEKMLAQYNTGNLFFSKWEGENVLVSEAAEVGPSTYWDPRRNRAYRFDHVEQKFVEEAPNRQQLDPQIERYRVAIETAVQGYLENYFTPSKFAFGVYANNDGLVTICISGKNVNLGSFWAGAWRSVYLVNVSAAGPTEVRGSIKLNVHYFEDANVQLNTSFDREGNIRVEDPEATARAVSSAIERLESDFHRNLEEFYVNMNQNTFKAMRRFMSVIRKPMEWNSNAHRLASEMHR